MNLLTGRRDTLHRHLTPADEERVPGERMMEGVVYPTDSAVRPPNRRSSLTVRMVSWITVHGCLLALMGAAPGLQGQGEPLFALHQELHGTSGGSAGSRAAALGLLDSDDSLDAVIGGQTGATVWINSGDGRFTPSQVLISGPFVGVRSLAVADVDGDGDPDIILLHTSGAMIWINQGGEQEGVRGEFELRQELFLGAGNPITMAVAPLFDTSQGPDIYVARGGTASTDVILRNDPEDKGVFSMVTVNRPSGQRYGQFALGDLTGNERFDAFGSTVGTLFANRILINTGSSFITGEPFGGYAVGVALGFLNGDNHLDAVTVEDSRTMTLWINDGNGAFQHQLITEQLSGTFRSLALGDFDGDGALDIIASGQVGHRVFANDGSGNFTEVTGPFGSIDQSWRSAAAIAVGDLNNNGMPDLLLLATGDFAEDQGYPDQVWLNQNPPPPAADMVLRIAGQQRRLSLNPLELVVDLEYVIENVGAVPLNNLRLRTDFPPNVLVFLDVQGESSFTPLASPNLWGLQMLEPNAHAVLRVTARKLRPEVSELVTVNADVRSDEIPSPQEASATIGFGGVDLAIAIEDLKDPVPLDRRGFPEHAEYNVTVTATRWGQESADNVEVEVMTAPSATISVPTSVPWEALDLRLLSLASVGIPTEGDRVLYVARNTNQLSHPLTFRLFN